MHPADMVMKYIIKYMAYGIFFVFLFFISYMYRESLPLFQQIGFTEFIFQSEWHPLSAIPVLGIRNMILSSIYVSVLALLIALPLGIGCALYSMFCLPERWQRYWLAGIDMLAGIPSVIFGFIGLVVLVKLLEKGLSLSSGECVLAGAIILAIMILPFIISNCHESMMASSELYRDASLNLGVGLWYTIRHIILPETFRAVSVSLILAFSRAVGETMAVMMVMGNTKSLPSLLEKGETIPSLIALEMGSAEYGSIHYHGLYAAGMVLLLFLVICNLLFYGLRKRKQKRGIS